MSSSVRESTGILHSVYQNKYHKENNLKNASCRLFANIPSLQGITIRFTWGRAIPIAKIFISFFINGSCDKLYAFSFILSDSLRALRKTLDSNITTVEEWENDRYFLCDIEYLYCVVGCLAQVKPIFPSSPLPQTYTVLLKKGIYFRSATCLTVNLCACCQSAHSSGEVSKRKCHQTRKSWARFWSIMVVVVVIVVIPYTIEECANTSQPGPFLSQTKHTAESFIYIDRSAATCKWVCVFLLSRISSICGGATIRVCHRWNWL